MTARKRRPYTSRDTPGMSWMPGTWDSSGSGLVLMTLDPSVRKATLRSRKATRIPAIALSMMVEMTSETPR